MTITVTSNTVVFQGNGAISVFDVPYVIDATTDIVVIYTDSDGAQTTIPPTSYLIAINPIQTGQLWPVGGTLTYPLSGSPIASGTSLTVMRILQYQQTTQIAGQGDFNPEVTEQALDILQMQIQQVAARTGQILGTWVTGYDYQYSDIVVDGSNGANTGNLYSCVSANTSGTWSTDLDNGLWSIALNVQSIVNTLPTISNNQVFGNISGMTATPIGLGVSALLDSAIGSTQGDILYRSGSSWTVLAPGTTGQLLKTQGAGANPIWSSASGTGTVTEVDTGTGLTGGPITGTGSISLATVADHSMLANVSGGTAAPGATTLSAYLDNVLGSTQGSIIYRGALSWAELTPGTLGQVLTTGGSAANPAWGGVNFSQSTKSDPTSTTSSSEVMMGLAGSFTPSETGTVVFSLGVGRIVNAGGADCSAQMRYGTGVAPSNGAAVTGTTIGPHMTKGTNVPFTSTAIVNGLTPATVYWIDMSLAAATGGGTASATSVTVTAYELK